MSPAGTDMSRARGARGVDLGWLFLLPGIVLIASAVLIAAEDDLYAARFRRDEAVAIERRHAERVARYEAYLEAVKRRDPTVVRSLAAGQLNASPVDMVEERVAGLPVYDAGGVFASLEPGEAEPAHRVRVDSVLARWATDDSSRVWLMASGALCVFVGLLPPVNRRGRVAGGTGVMDETEELVETDETDETDEAIEVEDGDGEVADDGLEDGSDDEKVDGPEVQDEAEDSDVEDEHGEDEATEGEAEVEDVIDADEDGDGAVEVEGEAEEDDAADEVIEADEEVEDGMVAEEDGNRGR